MAFVAFALLTIAWSFSVPLGSSPDEPHHVVKAAAVVRGEWLGVHAPGQNIAIMKVYVPETFEDLIYDFDCYRLKPDVSPACAPKLPDQPQIVAADTHVGRYPPLYYLLVGWPTLISTSAATVRWMRVVSCLIDSAIVGFIFLLIRRFRMGTGTVVGVCAALTPVVVYMDSTVQPNGLEVTLGLLVAVAVVGLSRFATLHPASRDASPAPPRMLVNALGAGASALVLVRGLSPLWLACLAVVGMILIPWSSWWRWLRTRQFLIWIGVLAISTGLALAWIIGAKTLQIQPWGFFRRKQWLHATLRDEIHIVAARTPWFIEQMVGALTHDAQPPIGAYVTSFVLFGLLILVGLVRGTWRHRIAIVVSVAATLIIPIALAAPRVHLDGINWQGRYILPFAVEVALVSAVGAFRRRSGSERERRVIRLFGALAVAVACAVEGVEYWGVLRRYAVSVVGPHDLLRLAHPLWSPVLPVELLAAAIPLLLLVMVLGMTGLMARSENGV